MDDRREQQARPRQLTSRSNDILRAIEELHQLEEKKRTEVISTPPFHALAEEIRDKSREIFRIASEQREIGDRTETADVSIDEVSGGSGANRSS